MRIVEDQQTKRIGQVDADPRYGDKHRSDRKEVQWGPYVGGLSQATEAVPVVTGLKAMEKFNAIDSRSH